MGKQTPRERDNLIPRLRAQLTTTEVEQLKLMIAKLRRMQVGRNSQELDHQIEQLELKLENLQATKGEAERERPLVDKALRSKAARKPQPEHLPHDEREYQPQADACPSCGGGLHPWMKMPRSNSSSCRPTLA